MKHWEKNRGVKTLMVNSNIHFTSSSPSSAEDIMSVDTLSLGGGGQSVTTTCHLAVTFHSPPCLFPSLRKGTTETAMGTPGCLTCQRSASTSTARRPPSRTRPARTSSRRTSRLPTSPSPTRSPATRTPTSATPSTSTPYTSRRRRTSSSRGPADRARTGSARTGGAAWRVRSWAWREARPG